MVVMVVHGPVHVCFSRFHHAKDEQWSEVESEPVMCNRQRYAKQAGLNGFPVKTERLFWGQR